MSRVSVLMTVAFVSTVAASGALFELARQRGEMVQLHADIAAAKVDQAQAMQAMMTGHFELVMTEQRCVDALMLTRIRPQASGVEELRLREIVLQTIVKGGLK